MFVVKDVT